MKLLLLLFALTSGMAFAVGSDTEPPPVQTVAQATPTPEPTPPPTPPPTPEPPPVPPPAPVKQPPATRQQAVQPKPTQTTSKPVGGVLERIKQCESGGNYSTNTGNGYYGAYQFNQSTWNSNGGSGNPAAASPAEQDRVAANLYAKRGGQPWPTCSRR